MIAGLVRALVETAAPEAAAGRATPDVTVEQLRLAQWRASRDGPAGELLDPHTQTPRPARAVIDALLDHAGPVLEAAGDLDRVRAGLDRVLAEGTGADLQRAALAASADPADVVRAIVEMTVNGD